MTGRRRWYHLVVSSALACVIGGCSKHSDITKLSFNASHAADTALAQYDTNHDGALAGVELTACPGIKSALPYFDKNGDGRVGADELRNRFQLWLDSPTRLMMLPCVVKLDGQPLNGATITLIPEKFLADAILPGEGITGDDGMAGISIKPADGSQGVAPSRGVRLGLYRVSVTHPSAKIPAKYNTETTLGIEVSPASSGSPVTFPLSSR